MKMGVGGMECRGGRGGGGGPDGSVAVMFAPWVNTWHLRHTLACVAAAVLAEGEGEGCGVLFGGELLVGRGSPSVAVPALCSVVFEHGGGAGDGRVALGLPPPPRRHWRRRRQWKRGKG